jgi:hypothetical protein
MTVHKASRVLLELDHKEPQVLKAQTELTVHKALQVLMAHKELQVQEHKEPQVLMVLR